MKCIGRRDETGPLLRDVHAAVGSQWRFSQPMRSKFLRRFKIIIALLERLTAGEGKRRASSRKPAMTTLILGNEGEESVWAGRAIPVALEEQERSRGICVGAIVRPLVGTLANAGDTWDGQSPEADYRRRVQEGGD